VGFGLDAHISALEIFGIQFGGLIHMMVFGAKLLAFILFFILVRWTVPRFRYDQLMKLGWVVFFEAALINVFLAALILAAPQFPIIITIFGTSVLITVTAAIIWVAKVSEDKTKPLRA